MKIDYPSKFFENPLLSEMFMFYSINGEKLHYDYVQFKKMEDSEALNIFQFAVYVFYLMKEKGNKKPLKKKVSKRKKI